MDSLFSNIAGFNVYEVKRTFLELADEAGSSVTTLFVMFGLFSVMVGILLIFLIFVMLSAARRTEMGMVRAVGGKRSHLVQMFIFEGTAYDLAASAIGVTVGLLVSPGIGGSAQFPVREAGRGLELHLPHRAAKRHCGLLPWHDYCVCNGSRVSLPRQPHEHRGGRTRPAGNYDHFRRIAAAPGG